MWHGTTQGLIYENYDYFLDSIVLRDSAVIYASSNTDKTNLARKIRSVRKKLDSDEKCVTPLYIKANTQNSSEINESKINNNTTYHYFLEGSRYRSEVYTEVLRKGYLDNVDFSELSKKVEILADLMNPEIKLDHNTLKGLATNLKWIKGGQSLYRDCINANPDYSEDKHNIMAYCREIEYIPMSLDSFSPYGKDWEYKNLLQAARLPRGEIIRKESYKPLTLAKGEIMLDDAINQALDDDSNSIWVIKKATGLGGTKKLLSLEGITIAFPNHDLKEEVAEKFKVPFQKTLELPLDALSETLRAKVEYLYEVGAIDKVYNLIREEAETNLVLSNYIDESIKAYKSSQTVLTTHAKALFVDFEHHNTVIFDEDPLPYILQIGEVSLSDLNHLVHIVTNSSDQRKLTQYINILSEDIEDCVEPTKDVVFNDIDSIEDAVLENSRFDSNILRFINSQYYAKDSYSSSTSSNLRFLKHNSLNSDVLASKKIIILSATANEFIYKQLYGDRVKFVDISNVEMKGIVVQNTQYSYSKLSLAQSSIREYVQEQMSNFKYLVTFKPYKQYFSNAVENLHYGKCTGFDRLKGQKIAVVGTPHLRTIDYLLYAKALGIQVCPQDFRLQDLRVQHNGFEFRFKTFNKQQLQIIQFHFIEEQMIQAIGRARLLRIPEEAMLFSNYPLPFALITEEEVARGREKLKDRMNEVNTQMHSATVEPGKKLAA